MYCEQIHYDCFEDKQNKPSYISILGIDEANFKTFYGFKDFLSYICLVFLNVSATHPWLIKEKGLANQVS